MCFGFKSIGHRELKSACMDPGGSQKILKLYSCVTNQPSGTLLAIGEKYLDFNLEPTNISPYDFMTLYSLVNISGFSFMLVFLIK